MSRRARVTDREKIAALCDAVRVLWECLVYRCGWDDQQVDVWLDPSKITSIHHLLKTCEEPRRESGQYPTDEESVGF